jgi:hypothetical protein
MKRLAVCLGLVVMGMAGTVGTACAMEKSSKNQCGKACFGAEYLIPMDQGTEIFPIPVPYEYNVSPEKIAALKVLRNVKNLSEQSKAPSEKNPLRRSK